MVFGSTPTLKSTISLSSTHRAAAPCACWFLEMAETGRRATCAPVHSRDANWQPGMDDIASHRVGQLGALTSGALPIAKQPVVAQAVSRNKADGFSWGLEWFCLNGHLAPWLRAHSCLKPT
ncbi:hypothetical protein F5144DRAFT_140129 [Chaetomium tenue]|uniref:Uncharacterized protein n=1 Tax=Chaetomium tenue TaxID=1854479 RepID=A0ACB7PKP6_9PEZI|nr:hypothetical protein F5144DRAFT_140129 [Chaetomium globosum]